MKKYMYMFKQNIIIIIIITEHLEQILYESIHYEMLDVNVECYTQCKENLIFIWSNIKCRHMSYFVTLC